MPLELVIFVGLQASGKTTFYRCRFAATHVHVSKDNFRNNPRPARRQEQLVTRALSEGRSVVVDNTNVRTDDRRQLIELGKRFGAVVIAYQFTAALDGCLERNRQRTGKARVADRGVAATSRVFAPPAPEEGYDAMYRVALGTNDAFDVAPTWPPDTPAR